MKSGTFDRRLLTILLVVFVQMLGASLILPVLPLYAQREFRMSAEMIALLTSAFFAAQFLAGPYIGRLSDHYGRIPVLIVSQIGTVISFVLLAFAPNFGWLFFARILDGITGGNIIVAQAYITDITPREKRVESLGYIYAVFGPWASCLARHWGACWRLPTDRSRPSSWRRWRLQQSSC